MTTKYRINGFEQIHRFFDIVKSNIHDMKPYHISLYLYFIDLNNSLSWVEWFKCSYESAMNGACIGSNKTYYRALSELKEFGLIDYKKGVNDLVSPQISIICLCRNTEPHAQPSSHLPAQINITDNIKSINKNSLSKEIESVSFLKNENKNIIPCSPSPFGEGWGEVKRVQGVCTNNSKLSLPADRQEGTKGCVSPSPFGEGWGEVKRVQGVCKESETILLPWNGDRFFKAWCDFVDMTMRVRKQKRKPPYTKAALEAKLEMLKDKANGNEKKATEILIRLISLDYLDIEVK